MSRRSRDGRQSELAAAVLDGLSTRLSRRSTLAPRAFSSSGFRLENSGKQADSVVAMESRVAVRDMAPHRFQVIPLREVDNFAVTRPERCTTPSSPRNCSLPGNAAHRILPSPIDRLKKENSQRQKADTYQNSSQTRFNLLTTTKSESNPPCTVAKKVLAEMDPNRDHTSGDPPSTSLEIYGPLLTAPTLRNGPRLAHASSPSLNDDSRVVDGKHQSLAAFSTNVSEISQLFCSEQSVSQPVRRRNRSLTVTTMRSDSSILSDMVEVEAKLKRRAIYRESHVSYLEKYKNSRRSDATSDSESWGSSLSHYSEERTILDHDSNLEDTPKHLQDAFVLKLGGQRVSPRALVSTQVNPKGPMQEIRPLNLVKAAKSDKPDRTGIRRDIVYPQIILDLVYDIDEAILDWNNRV